MSQEMSQVQDNPLRDLNNARNLPTTDCPRCEAGLQNIGNFGPLASERLERVPVHLLSSNVSDHRHLPMAWQMQQGGPSNEE